MEKVKSTHVILGVVAGIVLIAIFLYRSPGDPPFSTTTNTEISEAEKAVVLAPPLPEATTTYAESVARLAEESDTLTIGVACAMEPLVLRSTEGKPLFIENKDVTPHTVAFEDGGIFVLAPNYRKELNITEAFGKEEGIHRYRCDDLSATENVGVLYVVKQ